MKSYFLNQAKYGTHKLIAEELANDSTVLDVGCNRGYLKKISSRNVYYGIDNNSFVLQQALRNGYKKVYKLDLNYIEKIKLPFKFDLIVFADILEHILFPELVLELFIKKYLKSDGRVIISLPNIANITIRLNLLLGKFNYSESGILDKGHLYLYTLKTGRELVKASGLKIIKEKFSSNHFGSIIKIFPRLGTVLGYNLIFVCRN